jgi:hypothetical protein
VHSIIRILFMIPIYTLTSFLCIYFYKWSVYFELIGYCYEPFAIASFFTLLCSYIAPELHDQKEFFRHIEPINWVWPIPWMQKCTGGQNGVWRKPRSGLTWFNVCCPFACFRWMLSVRTNYSQGDLDRCFPILLPPTNPDYSCRCC